MLLEGQQFSHYRFVRLLERGGMSEIYLAEDTRLNRQVVIKIIQADIATFSDTNVIDEAVRLFKIEAKAVSMLDHPHILPLFDYGEESINGIILTYMVMPYRREGSLATWVGQHSRGILTPQEVAHFLRQAASALQYAHDHQIIHRDVKPPNFLIFGGRKNQNRPDLQLADFGVAKFMNAISTPSHIIRGTPTYMAPEQWRGEAVPATDQYALAVMVYELLTGHAPFEGDNQEQVLYQHLYVQPQPPSTLNPHIPVDVDNVLMRAMLKNPERRYASISVFARAFQQALIYSGDISVTLTISQLEAQTGTRRLVTFPGGRQVPVAIPAGVNNGQVIRFEGLGEQSKYSHSVGALIVTIIVEKTEEIVTLSSSESLERTIPALSPDVASNSQHRRPTFFLLIGLSILLILSGFGLLFYTTVANQPATTTSGVNAGATDRVQTTIAQLNANATSHANASATTQAGLTIATNTSASAVAANATATASAAAANATATASAVAANATATASAAAATATAYSGTVTVGTPALNDPLQDNSQGDNWDVVNIVGGGGCAFIQGTYHSTMPQKGYFSPCFARNTNFSNFSYQVRMTIVNGDQGGICFRADADKGTFYYFYINTNGFYGLETYDNYVLTGTLTQGTSPAIKTSLKQSNLVAVVANAGSLDLYVNMQLIASVIDNTYTLGEIGVVAEDVNIPTDVMFSKAQVWTR